MAKKMPEQTREDYIKSIDSRKEKPTAEQRERLIELYDLEVVNEKENATRSGVGTRLMAGMTRGKGSQVIKYEAFDEGQDATLPKSFAEFQKVTGITDEKDIVKLLITGFNDKQYTEASDPIAEYVDKSWTPEKQALFRNAVRTTAKILGKSIDEVATSLKANMA